MTEKEYWKEMFKEMFGEDINCELQIIKPNEEEEK